ncbi:MAG: universal stress protein [Pseudomonadota bacterium]
MRKLQHILSATDLSASSLEAVDRGFLLAAEHGARHTVLHALGLDALAPLRALLGGQAAGVSARLIEQAQAELTQAVAESAQAHGLQPQLVVEEGAVTDVLPRSATARGADLLLVGAHGSGFLQRMLLGSTTSQLLRKSRQPVLVVKQEPRHAYRRALVPVDFSAASRACVELARTVAPQADLLLHVFEVPFEGKMQFAGVGTDVLLQYRSEMRERCVRQLHELAAAAGLQPEDYTGVVLHGDAVREVIVHEERDHCDLIVMGKHGTHVTEELLLGSVTQRVLAESQGDVLVVVDPNAAPVPTLA